MLKTNTLYRDNDSKSRYPKSGKGQKWKRILKAIWDNRKEHEGKGAAFIPSDPNALLERLDMLLASKKAGHTDIENKLVSTCDKLKRQGVLDSRSYKKLNSVIKR